MSGMLKQGWKAALLAALAIGAGACQLPSPGGRNSQAGAEASDGWLFRRLTGQSEPVAQTQQTQPQAGQNAAAQAGGASQPGSPAQPNPVQPAAANLPGDSVPYDPAVKTLGSSLATATPPVKEEDEGFDWSDLDPQNVYKKVKAALGYGPNEQFAEATYKEGLALYRERKFAEAIPKFATAADRWPDSPLEEDALFYMGESYFFDDQYSKAHDTFLMLFKKFTNSRYLDVAAARQFQIGRYWEQADNAEPHWAVTPNFFEKSRPWFDTFGNAMNAYTSVHINDPTGPLADASVMAMGNAYFDRRRFEDAAINYKLLRSNYPKSKYQVKAHMLGLEAEKLIYQGPLYDGRPLDEADKIAKQALTQFRTELGEDRDRLVDERRQLSELQAHRGLELGRFWETKQFYGAARLCYQTTIQDYPGTQSAGMAQERLVEIKDKPAQPPDRMQWITTFSNLLKEKQ